MDREAEIGYGKPPIHSRYKKGQSGNAKGRPTQKPQLGHPHQVLIELLRQHVTLKVANKTVKMTKHEALLTRLWSAAMNGDNAALVQIIKMVDKLPPHLLEDVETFRENSESEKLIEKFRKRAEKYRNACFTPSED